nr:MAG TPA: hypothetical protein [Caudoviricetes sp.]
MTQKLSKEKQEKKHRKQQRERDTIQKAKGKCYKILSKM